MTDYKAEFEKKLGARTKKPSKLEEDSFIDWDVIYSFCISSIIHIIILVSLWGLIMNIYGEAYNKRTHKIKKKPNGDIVIKLSPTTTSKTTFNNKKVEYFYRNLNIR